MLHCIKMGGRAGHGGTHDYIAEKGAAMSWTWTHDDNTGEMTLHLAGELTI